MFLLAEKVMLGSNKLQENMCLLLQDDFILKRKTLRGKVA